MSDQRRRWRYGLIGCGRFGRFCLEAVRRMDRLEVVAVADADRSAAERLAGRFGVSARPSPEHLLGQADLDLVHIASPPFTHHELGLRAIEAGCHVLCEKPLALSVAEADELVEAARSRGVWLAVNHLLRHSGLLGTVKRLIDSGLLGEPLRAVLENYAEDERVPADHWFWDERKSGGIFIEHGVHFFDLYRWWFGGGSVLAARLHRRPGTAQADRAWCVVEYDNGVVGQFYHGFDQTYRLDRAEHRIVFERGDVRVIGWVPMELQVYGIVDDRQRQELQALCSQANLELLEHYGPQQQLCHGRGKTYRVTCRLLLRQVLPAERRGQVYSEMFESLLGDQLERLEDERHRPAVTAEDAREAVGLAAAATDLARR